MSDQATFQDVVAGRPPSVVELATAARELIHELDPGVVEVPWPRQGTIGFGIGPKKFTEHYAYLALHPRHVNLGFNQGAELPDPSGLLGGRGALLRHLKLTNPQQFEQPAIRELLISARAHRGATRPSSGFRPIGWWLKEADARLEEAFDVRLRAHGVTSRRGWQVLASAARAPLQRADIVADLSAFDSAAAIDQLIERLIDEGWVTDDAGTLRLTAEGEDLHAQLAAGIAEIRSWVAEALPGEDYQTLIDLLRRLVEAFPPVPERF